MVTALGCFGGDFNIDNGLLLSFSYKVSDLLPDKSSGLSMQPHETLTRSSYEGGSDHTATVTSVRQRAAMHAGMRMPHRRDAKSLHRPNPAESAGVSGGLVRDPRDQSFVPLRKKTIAFCSPIQLGARAMCHQRKNSFTGLA